jgi:two-component system chemotaxis sensor kinase CheA
MYNRLYIVVLKSAGSRYGLIVDKLHEPQEVVVKPLSSRLKSVKIFSGATIKSDGKVSMILDADGIAQDSEMRLTELSQDDDRYDYANIKEAQSMLEFTCGTQDSFALNLSMVSRVHRIMPGQLHQTAGQEFLKHDGTSLRVIRLSDHIKLSEPEADHDFQYVLIPKLIKNPMGILIDKPVGVFETDEALDTEKINEVGVHGTLIIDEKFMIFLDLYSLFNKVSPEKIEAQISASSIENMRVLYAEDTALFRTVVSKFLKELKFGQVDVVNDGQLGWDQLKRENYDLLVTDIVMPNMNGMELAQKVRMDDSMKDLPIIAVTSLANESDKKKILASGVDIYLQKLDRDGLNKAIIKLLSPSSKATA